MSGSSHLMMLKVKITIKRKPFSHCLVEGDGDGGKVSRKRLVYVRLDRQEEAELEWPTETTVLSEAEDAWCVSFCPGLWTSPQTFTDLRASTPLQVAKNIPSRIIPVWATHRDSRCFCGYYLPPSPWFLIISRPEQSSSKEPYDPETWKLYSSYALSITHFVILFKLDMSGWLIMTFLSYRLPK